MLGLRLLAPNQTTIQEQVRERREAGGGVLLTLCFCCRRCSCLSWLAAPVGALACAACCRCRCRLLPLAMKRVRPMHLQVQDDATRCTHCTCRCEIMSHVAPSAPAGAG